VVVAIRKSRPAPNLCAEEIDHLWNEPVAEPGADACERTLAECGVVSPERCVPVVEVAWCPMTRGPPRVPLLNLQFLPVAILAGDRSPDARGGSIPLPETDNGGCLE